MRLLVSRHLENFLALYDARNMHLAADRKGITQPALSKSLRAIEKEVGTELFRRTTRGLEPTAAGESLHRYAQAVDQQLRFAALDLRKSLLDTEARLRMGIGPAVAVSTFPAVLAAFHRTFPAVQVTVETAINRHLIDGLVHGALDLIVTARPDHALPDEYARINLFRHRMVAICRQGHPLRTRQNLSISDLTSFKRIGFLDDQFDRHSRRALGRRVEQFDAAISTESVSVMLDLLNATDHFAFVSEAIVARALAVGLAPLQLTDRLWSIDIDLMCKATFLNSRPIKSLVTTWRTHRE
jgi:DNA-binding transcriptional LysR family regulator